MAGKHYQGGGVGYVEVSSHRGKVVVNLKFKRREATSVLGQVASLATCRSRWTNCTRWRTTWAESEVSSRPEA